jgi:YfiH family protein
MRGVFCTKDLTIGIDGGPASVRAMLGGIIPGSDIFCLDQVHSGRVVLAEDLAPFETPRADGIISRNPDAVLCVRTADCVPVLAWARDMPLNAAVHAGWRGLAQGIVATCIRMMRALGARDIRAGIGPSIGPCCYEVGREVLDALGAEPLVRADGSLMVDLREAARSQLLDSGLSGTAVEMHDLCTACNTDRFFSYRRQGQPAGRNLSLIGGESWSLPGLPVG